eukprot:2105321-Amphidinium_carterae.1
MPRAGPIFFFGVLHSACPLFPFWPETGWSELNVLFKSGVLGREKTCEEMHFSDFLFMVILLGGERQSLGFGVMNRKGD